MALAREGDQEGMGCCCFFSHGCVVRGLEILYVNSSQMRNSMST